MAKKSYKLTRGDRVELLAEFLGELQGSGFRIAFKDAAGNDRRGPGLLVYIEGVKTKEGDLVLIG